jgi:hypothetical protein
MDTKNTPLRLLGFLLGLGTNTLKLWPSYRFSPYWVPNHIKPRSSRIVPYNLGNSSLRKSVGRGESCKSDVRSIDGGYLDGYWVDARLLNSGEWVTILASETFSDASSFEPAPH